MGVGAEAYRLYRYNTLLIIIRKWRVSNQWIKYSDEDDGLLEVSKSSL